MTGRRADAVLLVLAFAAAVAGFLPALGHGFVYDDHRFVEGNPGIDAVAAAPWKALDPATTGLDGAEPGMWRPLRTLSFALDRLLLGPGPFGHHLVSVLLHGLGAALVFAAGRALGLGGAAALLGAAVYGLHPVQAEAAAWISARGDLLCDALLLGACLAHLRGARLATASMVGLAFLAKESAVAAPLLLVAADLAAGGPARVRARIRGPAFAALGLLPLVIARWAVLSGSAPFGQDAGLGLGPADVALAVPSMLAHYAGRVLLPSPGTFDLQVGATVGLTAGFLALAGGLIWIGRVRPLARLAGPARAGAAWALAALVPVTLLQVVFPLKILVADRFLHLALAGPALALGAAADRLGPWVAGWVVPAAPALLLAALPAQARWESDERLWSPVLAEVPGNARALQGLAAASTDPAKQAEYYAAYLERAPGDAGAWYRRGIAEEALGNSAAGEAVARGRFLSAAHGLGEAVRLWVEGGAIGGRARGLTAARLARACVLARLGGTRAEVADAAASAYEAWRGEPPAARARLETRVLVLRRWAASTGDAALVEALARPPVTP